MTTINRRKFVAAAAGTAVTAAAAGVAGEMLIGKRFRNVVPEVAAPAPAASPPAQYRPIPIAPMTPLPADETLTIPGLSPFYTPNSEFYRVDTALTVPQIAARTWQLRIHGMVDRPMTITYEQLAQMPMSEHDVTLTCVSEAVGGGDRKSVV